MTGLIDDKVSIMIHKVSVEIEVKQKKWFTFL